MKFLKANDVPRYCILYAFLIFELSCKPVINSFTVTPLTISINDTVRVNWSVKGTPTLLIHHTATEDSSRQLMELKLVVEKNNKEANRVVQVAVLPANTTTSIVFSTELHGDTLVAADEKDSLRWGSSFEILSVMSTSGRPVWVSHANRDAYLDKTGSPSSAFEGTPVGGRWELRSLLTPAEKADLTIAPETLQVNAIVRYKTK